MVIAVTCIAGLLILAVLCLLMLRMIAVNAKMRDNNRPSDITTLPIAKEVGWNRGPVHVEAEFTPNN